MRIPARIIDPLARRLINRAMHRDADFAIGGRANPQLLRWYLTPWSKARRVPSESRTILQRIGAWLPGVYLHWILRNDDDRALHDHPWPNVSVPLRDSYIDHTIAAGGIHHRTRRTAGEIVFRTASAAHRLEIDDVACWSLFITGFRTREWGFHCPEAGWVHWRDFTNPDDGGATVGRGCGE